MTKRKSYSYKGTKEDGKNTMILIGILLVLILVAGGALVLLLLNKMGEEPPPPEPPPDIIEPPTENVTNITEECDDNCVYDKAMAEQDHSYCQNITDSALSQQCYAELSDVSLDACLMIEDQGMKESCVTVFAVDRDDISICDQLVEGKERCMDAVDPCRDIEDQDLCYALESENPSLCNSDTDCLLNYSLAKKDSEACYLMQNNVLARSCESTIKGSDYCHTLPTTPERDYCYQMYAMYTDDWKICTSITYNTIYALDCFSTFAARMSNLSICQRDGFYLDMLWDCYTNYSLLSGDLSGCEEIDELATTHKFKCAFEYSKKFGNPAACDIISPPSKRDTCYQGSIIYTSENLDWIYCGQVLDFNWRNKCYNEAAKVYGDSTICDYIEDDFARNACHIAFEVNQTG